MRVLLSFRKRTEGVRLMLAGPDDGYLAQLNEDVRALESLIKYCSQELFTKKLNGAYIDDVYFLPLLTTSP
jgi:hypothetical protein